MHAPHLLRRLAVVAALVVTSCGAPAGTGDTEGELVLYSARKEELLMPLVEAFQMKTGINVIVKSGGAGELALLIEQERSSPRADVLWTTDAATAETLRQKGLLEAYRPAGFERVPAEFKAEDGSWVGVVGRYRAIMYNTDLVRPEDAPTSIFELTEPQWRGRVAIASIREGGVRLFLSWLIVEKGEDFAVQYIKDLKANGLVVLTNHTEVRRAVGRGEIHVGLVNHYYYVFEKREGSPVEIVYPDQGPDQVGTLVTPIAGAIVKGGPHPNAARAFMDYILTAEAQSALAQQSQEFPLVEGVPIGFTDVPIEPPDRVKHPKTDFVRLASAEQRAVELFTPLLSAP